MEKAQRSPETLPGGTVIWTSPRHPLCTDAFLLADFARPRKSFLAADLGAGCGVVGLLLLERGAPPRRVTAVELQEEGVVLMEETVRENGLEDSFIPLRADLRALAGVIAPGGALAPQSLDLVVCNPPYFSPGTGETTPHPARLAARHEGEGSCTLDEVCAAARGLLKYGGRLCLCHRPERLADLLAALRGHDLEPKRLRMVHQREDKAPWLVLVEGKRGGRPSLVVEAPLIMEEPDGRPTPEGRRPYEKQ